MSKLTDVRNELAANPAASIIEDREKKFLQASGMWNHWVELIVVPARGLYTTSELQEFMNGLVTVKPTDSDRFRSGGTDMEFGKLYFDEAIGTIVTTGTQTITITDPDVVAPDDYKEGVLKIDMSGTVELMRRTLLWVYPDEHYARQAVDQDTDVYSTRLPLTINSRRGMFARRRG